MLGLRPAGVMLGGGLLLALFLGALANDFRPSLSGISDAGPQVVRTQIFRLEGERLPTEIVTVLTDESAGTVAVVLLLENNGTRPLADVPIAIELLGPDGEQVGTNTAKGTDPTLNHLPSLAPGRSLYVNDAVLLQGQVATAQARAAGQPASGPLREVELSGARVEASIYGTSVVGKVRNPSGEPLRNVLVEAIVRRGETIVAAGTAHVAKLAPRRAVGFQIFLVGDPKGGEPTVWAPPL